MQLYLFKWMKFNHISTWAKEMPLSRRPRKNQITPDRWDTSYVHELLTIKCVNKFGSFHLHDIEAPPFSLSFQFDVDSDVVDISNQHFYDPLALLNGRGAIMS